MSGRLTIVVGLLPILTMFDELEDLQNESEPHGRNLMPANVTEENENETTL